jgi:short-subunit dehydrogenase
MGAYAPVPGQSVYGASKAAIAQLSDGLRSELQRTHIGVTTVYPGAINTNIAANSGINVPATSASKMAIKTTDAKVAAKQMVAGIENRRERIFIGNDSRTLNILSRVNPKFAASLIYRNMRTLLGE